MRDVDSRGTARPRFDVPARQRPTRIRTGRAGVRCATEGGRLQAYLLRDRKLEPQTVKLRVSARCANQDRQSRRRTAMLSQQTHGRRYQDTRHHDR